jgi:D-alanyl-D-alanine-carboxypeptidase/D-alanyl-D-alanine-endopeptidase
MRKLAGPVLRMLALIALPGTAHAQNDAKPAATPAPAPPRPQLPANWVAPADATIAELIDARIAQRRGEGIVVGVLDRSGRRIVARGPGGSAAPFDARTVFEIGSMSKIFTALLLADMVAKGEVSLDDPAEKYLPAGAKMPERNGRKITLRDLSNQHSGLPRLPSNMPFGNPEDPYADYTEKMMLDFLGGYQLTRDIGSQFEYSNLGVGLLGYLLGRAGRSDYETMIARRITGPLGMHDTAITLSPGQRARFAQGHDQYMRPTAPWTLPTLAGAGAIRSTITDMLIFVGAALNPKSPLAPAMKLATAERWPLGAPGRAIGLGWIISEPEKGRETLFHNGGTGGFRAAMVLEPAKASAVVVLTNASVEPSSDDLAMHILLGTPLQPLVPVPPAPPPQVARTKVALPPAELDRVVGRYEFAPGITLSVEREGTGLKAQLTGQPPLPIFAEAPLSFFLRATDAQLRFTAGADGKVTGVTLIQAGQPQNAKRITP